MFKIKIKKKLFYFKKNSRWVQKQIYTGRGKNQQI